ncbi:MAG: hypothetical protein QG597_4573 [Actinomycetota bacterium]|nr:hypothetical protein [Actinomycetota bacterium]
MCAYERHTASPSTVMRALQDEGLGAWDAGHLAGGDGVQGLVCGSLGVPGRGEGGC